MVTDYKVTNSHSQLLVFLYILMKHIMSTNFSHYIFVQSQLFTCRINSQTCPVQSPVLFVQQLLTPVYWELMQTVLSCCMPNEVGFDWQMNAMMNNTCQVVIMQSSSYSMAVYLQLQSNLIPLYTWQVYSKF